MLIQHKAAHKIIESWISYATAAANVESMVEHRIEFWTARDAIEGRYIVPMDRVRRCANFIKGKCKPSADRDTVLAALDQITGGIPCQ